MRDGEENDRSRWMETLLVNLPLLEKRNQFATHRRHKMEVRPPSLERHSQYNSERINLQDAASAFP